MNKKKTPYKQVGITTDWKPVMGGLFQAADTFGIPLDVSIIMCMDSGCCPGLHDYAVNAIKAGWPIGRIVNRIRMACESAEFELPPNWEAMIKTSPAAAPIPEPPQ